MSKQTPPDETKAAVGQSALNVELGAWIKVEDSLPKPYSRNIRKNQGILAYVKDPANIYGGMPMILFYGAFEFCDYEGVHPDCDEDGMVKRFGWNYERDSEGEFDTLIFDMNRKVSHWMPLPEAHNGTELRG